MNGISNYEVYQNLEPDSYLWKYLGYGAQQTDAPYLYHVVCGLAAAAAVLPFEARILGFGDWIHGNFWGMLVGSSGRERRGTCTNIAMNLVESVCPDHIGAAPGTSQGLQDALIEEPNQIIPLKMDEHLPMTNKRAYEDIRGTMSSAHDCRPVKRALAGGVRGVEAVRLSVLAGATPECIEAHTDRTARMGGYLSRYGVFLARREHFKVAPESNEAGRLALVEHLTELRDLDLTRSGCVGWADEAVKMWEDWSAEVEAEVQKQNGNGHNALTRAQELALKVSLIDALANFRHNPEGNWALDATSLKTGITVATWHVRCAHIVYNQLCDTIYKQNRRRLVDFLAIKERTASAVSRHMLMPPRQTDDLINGLRRENRLESTVAKDQTVQTLGTN